MALDQDLLTYFIVSSLFLKSVIYAHKVGTRAPQVSIRTSGLCEIYQFSKWSLAIAKIFSVSFGTPTEIRTHSPKKKSLLGELT